MAQHGSTMDMVVPNSAATSEPQFPAEIDGARSFLVRSWTGTCFPCLTGPTKNLQVSTVVQPESFTAMIVADLLLGIPSFRRLANDIIEMLENELGDEDVYYFFKDHGRLPADADCTAIGLSVLLRAGLPYEDTAHSALTRIRANCSSGGVIETYFDPTGERSGLIDSVVCANVLYLAHQMGRQDEFQATEDYLVEVLLDGRYLAGTRYYPSPDTLLYFLGRVVGAFSGSRLALRVRRPLQQAIVARIGASGSPIDLAQRVLVCSWLGMRNDHEATRIAALQGPSGSWPADSLFQYGRTKVHFGSSDLSTTYALAALQAVGMLESVDQASSMEALREGAFDQISGMEIHFAVLGEHLR
jgi:hypothetical protein